MRPPSTRQSLPLPQFPLRDTDRERGMAEAYIVSAVRTAGGRKGGRLAGAHPVDLAAISLNAVAERSGIDPAAIEDVIMGCVTQAGEQSLHVGRNAVLASNLPQSVPAVIIDRRCGASQRRLRAAAPG